MNDLEIIFGKVRDNDSSTKTGQICTNLFVPMEFRVYLAMKVDCVESYDLYKNQSLEITLKVEINGNSQDWLVMKKSSSVI
jgi:hypothetical protein